MRWHCLDCGGHTGFMGEYYVVHDDLWEQSRGGMGMLCLADLERRLGRPLRPADFTDAPVNEPEPGWTAQHWAVLRSPRLLDLLQRRALVPTG